MKRMIESGEARDAEDVRRELNLQCSSATVRCAFVKMGLNGRVRRKKPFLTRKAIGKRKTWAADHIDMPQSQWDNVVFSNESKYQIVGSDGKRYCRRRVGEENLERNVRKIMK